MLQRRTSLSSLLQPLTDAAFIGTLFFYINLRPEGGIGLECVLFFLLLLGAMAFTYDTMGIYRRNRTIPRKVLDIAKAWAASFGGVALLVYALKLNGSITSQALAELFIFGFVFQVLSHLFFRFFLSIASSKSSKAAVVVGDGAFAKSIAETLNKNPWSGERVVATVGLDELVDGCPKTSVLIDQLKLAAGSERLRAVYLVLPIERGEFAVKLYQGLVGQHVDVHWVPDTRSLDLVNPSIKEVNGNPVVSFSETPLLGLQSTKKALLDRIIASIALVALSPVMIVTAIAVKLSSPGPVFFKQQRTGWDGQVFSIWKFRSMRTDANPVGQVIQTTKEDPRVTRVGRFIRKTSIDELPQLFNVLDGSMSVVGPRPHAIQHDQEYSALIDSYLTRHRIKPGITGLAQVRGFRGETETVDLMAKRVSADLEYINTWSIGLDIRIIFMTALTLLNNRAY